MEETVYEEFHWADYLVFILSVVGTAVIGLVVSCYKRKVTNTEEMLVGSRKLNGILVGLRWE